VALQTTKTGQGAACLRIGTGGYSYTEWVEVGFYPPGIQAGKMLPFYAEHFGITELNQTWYQMPAVEAMERRRLQVPEDFLFIAKLVRGLSDEGNPSGWRRLVDQYREGIAPLAQAHQLGAVLAQFPLSFDRSPKNRSYLAALLDALYGLPLAVEFRHGSWAQDRVFAELSKRRVALVAVDQPPLPDFFPALDVVTAPDFFYVRFYGRSRKGWHSDHSQKQFDYDYSREELSRWAEEKIPRMAAQAERGFLLFINHVRGQAPKNARMLIELLQ